MCSPLGTIQGSLSFPPCPPNWGDRTVVTPSLNSIWILSTYTAERIWIFLALKVGLTWDHEKGYPPPPPYGYVFEIETVAGCGLGLSEAG